MIRWLMLLVAVTLTSCTLAGERTASDGVVEHQIVAGPLMPWSLHEGRAGRICPTGFTVASKRAGFDESEMIVRCKTGL